jgi:TRAP-type mannitol/chloroaromatic compound transport system permease small subunit
MNERGAWSDYGPAQHQGEKGNLAISMRAAGRGWGYNVSPRIARASAGSDDATDVSSLEPADEPAPEEEPPVAADDSGDGGATAEEPVESAPGTPWPIHPLGAVAVIVLVVAVVYHTVLDTKYLIGNLDPWMWAALVVTVAISLWPLGLHGLRIGLDAISSVTKRISMALAWGVFLVQFFNVVTRYGTRYTDADILIGQATSLAWQFFAALFLLGANYGLRDGVNPRIDFWWANFSEKKKAWLDFVLHVTLLLPFFFMAIRILQPYAAISLGRKRDGTWPSGYKVWETWEQSPDADQLPVGPIKVMILVCFVLLAIQLVSELIKTGFIVGGRREYGNIKVSDVPQRIE